MRPDYRKIVEIAADYGERAVVLSPFSYSLILSLLRYAIELFQWSVLTEAERLEAVDAVDHAVFEMGMNAMLGWVVPVAVTIPAHMLLCDGSVHQRVDYPDLYAVLDTAFIVDASSFRVPDLRRKSVFGAGGDWSIGETGGSETHTLTLDEIPAHSHTYTAPMIGNLDFEDVGVPQPATSINPIPQSTSSAGTGQAHANMPPYLVLQWAMVAR